ncbi:hypothetical protein [Streptomyces sp. NPDC005209]|uniref:hypothetical protein n=1 Tax=Streptomyces sp. NPDC005209 TaxID=3156715 RepID=UPI0033BC8122
MTEISEVAARRAELDQEESLVKRLEEVRAEREELAVAMRVWERMHAQLAAEKPPSQAVTAQVGGSSRTGSPARAKRPCRRTISGA